MIGRSSFWQLRSILALLLVLAITPCCAAFALHVIPSVGFVYAPSSCSTRLAAGCRRVHPLPASFSARNHVDIMGQKATLGPLRASRGEEDDAQDGTQYHEVPSGGPGSSGMWRGIPLDRRKLLEERTQNRNSEVLLKASTPQVQPPAKSERKKKETADNFFSNTYRKGKEPQEGGGDFFSSGPSPRSISDRRTLRPTQGAPRPGGTRIVDGLRMPAAGKSFFEDPRSLDPRQGSTPSAPPTGGTQFPSGYSAPLSGFNAPLSSTRTSSPPLPVANSLLGRKIQSPAVAGKSESAAPAAVFPADVTSVTGDLRPSTSTSGSEIIRSSVKTWDPREGEKLVASLKPGEAVVHNQHGVCRFRAIENNVVGKVARAYLVLDFADGTLREQASNAPTLLTRYLGSGRGYRKKKSASAEEDDDELDDVGPALDYLSRPEIWKKRKSKAKSAIRKLATDVVKLQALRSSKNRPPYPLTDGGALYLHVPKPPKKLATAILLELDDVDDAREEMLAMGFDAATIERALQLSHEGKTTTAAAVAADLEATGGTMSRRAAFEAGFPYTLTPDQASSIQDIQQDMCQETTPMDRLVCGDVGFGKTEVAFRAILTCVLAGRQSIMLAPTTVLAAQHFRNVMARFETIGLRVALLSRYTPPKEKKAIFEKIATHKLDIIVGTHALLSPKIEFCDLGLVVVDEEQRFGVNQKEKLKALAVGVDVLTLSATPIPRTLQLAMSGLREMSTILSPPPMRRQIETRVSPAEEDVVREALQRELVRGGQCYCVVPRIADTDQVASMINKLAPDARIVIANGQQSDVEDRLMYFGV